ncbi:FAD binding domain-containing protein [Methylobacterium sp. JK268]
MRPFAYLRAASAAEAVAAAGEDPGAAYLGGGTTLLDLMKQDVARPSRVVDLTHAPDLAGVAVEEGELRVGAAATLARVARDPRVRQGWPLLVETILKGLTPQLRDAATFGGNVTQRPRCIYFREAAFACNKKAPGSGCAAKAGVHHGHAILGGEAARDCIAVHPSDLCVALTALGARLHLADPTGATRVIPITAYHRLPGDDPTRETNLHPGELVTAVSLPARPGWRGHYAKVPRDGFALASAAALLRSEDGSIAEASLVLGGVAHRPWLVPQAAALLHGRAPDEAAFREVAEAALADAATDPQTAYRATLVREVVVEALTEALRSGAAR